MEESANTNNKEDTTPAATSSSTSTSCLASRNPAPSNTDASGTRNADLQTFLSKRDADLQAALNKHCDNVLCLLRMGTMAGQNIIHKKMLTKVRKANMTTMTQVNTLIARTGGKELSTQRLKELGSVAEHKAIELYNAKVAKKNNMEHGPPPNINSSINSDVCVCVISTSSRGGLPSDAVPTARQIHLPQCLRRHTPLSDTPSASPWEDVS